MRKTLPLLVLLLSLSVFAQTTTYTVTQNACGMKTNGMCQLSVVNQNNNVGYVTIDNRSPYRIGYLDLGTFGQNEYHGSYAFPGPPSGNGTASFYGAATYVSDDGSVTGEFQVYAYYVKTCSGRACGGTLGWHYNILQGSTVSKE